MLGVPCEIDKIKSICKKYNLFLQLKIQLGDVEEDLGMNILELLEI